MPEFFVTARTFAAPIVSDCWDEYIEAPTAEEALEALAARTEPYVLYAAEAWEDAEHFHRSKGLGEPLARWLSNKEIEKRKATAGLHGYGYQGHGPAEFSIFKDGVEQRFHVEDPGGGRIVSEEEFAVR